MKPEFRTQYWHDAEARRAFCAFIKKIHGLDFTLWENLGYWDHLYTPFSYFQEGTVISSVCIYSMPFVVNGSRCRVAQVSGVGTLPEYRRRGLNRELTQVALEWARRDHAFVFLFADEDAVPFYHRCGFRPVREFAGRVTLRDLRPRTGMRKLDPLQDAADRNLIYERARRRETISDRFGNLNPELVMYHALYGLREHASYIQELDTCVFWRRREERTIIFDLIATRVPSIGALAPYLAESDTEEFEFRFPADKLGLPAPGVVELCGNHPHLWGECPLSPPLIFPHTCHA